MPQRRAIVAASVGLHARPAAIFTQAVAESGVAVTIENAAGRRVNAASILGVLTLGVACGETVVLHSDDPRADPVLERLAGLLELDLEAQQ